MQLGATLPNRPAESAAAPPTVHCCFLPAYQCQPTVAPSGNLFQSGPGGLRQSPGLDHRTIGSFPLVDGFLIRGSGTFLLRGVAGNRVYDEGVTGVPKPLDCHSEGVSGAVSLQRVQGFMKGE